MNLTDVSKSLDIIQATLLAVNRKFKSFGSKAARSWEKTKKKEKEENLGSVTDGQYTNSIDKL